MWKWLSAFMLLSACAADMPSSDAARNRPSRPGLSEGWVSSGGELLRDSHNPWWVKNTKKVSYCIAIDAASITVDEARVDKNFRNALTIWKDDFNSVINLVREYGKQPNYDALGVTSQEFEKVSCAQSPDLRVVLGYGALTPDEQRYLPDPERFVAYAVRTDYDPINLKGKGFIYLGSEIGPYRFRQEKWEKPWQNDLNMGRVLLHELGHVFGIPHLDHEIHYMSEGYVEQIFAGKPLTGYYNSRFDAFMMCPQLGTGRGMMTGILQVKYYKDTPFYKYFEMEFPGDLPYALFSMNQYKGTEEVFYKKILYMNLGWRVGNKEVSGDIATLTFTENSIKMLPVASLFVTPEQNVFTDVDYKDLGFSRLEVVHHITLSSSGTAELHNKKKKPIYVEYQSLDLPKLFGLVDGRLTELKHEKD